MGCALTVIMFAIFAAVFALTCNQERSLDEILVRPDSTDDEFIHQLGSETSPEIALKVRRALADTNGWDVEEIWPDTRLAELCD